MQWKRHQKTKQKNKNFKSTLNVSPNWSHDLRDFIVGFSSLTFLSLDLLITKLLPFTRWGKSSLVAAEYRWRCVPQTLTTDPAGLTCKSLAATHNVALHPTLRLQLVFLGQWQLSTHRNVVTARMKKFFLKVQFTISYKAWSIMSLLELLCLGFC